MLGVSRQTIYKWETGITYPDIDKICDISRRLEVTTVYLLDGEEPATEHVQPVSVAPTVSHVSKNETVKHFFAFARGIGFSTFLILLGVALLVAFAAFDSFIMTAIGVVVILTAIFIAVIGYISSGIRQESFKKEIDTVVCFDQAEIKNEARRFTVKICVGLALIFIGIITVVIFGLLKLDDFAITIAVAGMLVLIGIACYFFITGGIMHELYNTPEKAMMSEEEEKKKSSLEEAISGIIMAVATATFLVLGFCFDLWHPGWVTFPIGAILSGCVSSVIKLARGKTDDPDDE